jgi:pimeloyl-ACP methyl ester carboxylesterase
MLIRRMLAGMTAAALVAGVVGAAQSTRPSTMLQAQTVQGGPYQLRGHVFQGKGVSEHPVLLVVLHGDLGTDYINNFAEQAADDRDVVAVALLRPGYSDKHGDVSDGSKGQTNGDSYNATNTDAIADAIVNLKQQFHARKVVLAGHSGGAAISANILGRHPDVADAALLVSCPCNVPVWRRHMFRTFHYPEFKGTISTLSPIDLVAGLSDKVEVTMLVGTKDDVAPPSLSRSYLAAGAKFHKHVLLREIPDAQHNMLLEPVVMTYLAPMLQ